MRVSKALVATGLAMIMSSTSAQVSGPNKFAPPLQLPIDAAYTYFPTSDWGDFRAMSGQVGGGADLTCSGVTMQGSIETMIANYTAMAGQLVSNAPGIAVNYLAYSSPTTYALIQNLKESFEMNLNGSNMACQLARSTAQKNWDEKPEQARAVECMEQNGGLTAECVGSVEGPVGKFLEKKQEWSSTIDDAISDVNSFFSTDCEVLNSDQPTLVSYTLARGPNKCKDIEMAKKLLVDMEINAEEGGMKPIAPDESFSDVVQETAEEYKERIDEIVSTPTDSLVESEAYQELIADNRIALSYSQHRLLTQIKEEDPLGYEAYSKRLATLMAVNELEGVARKIEAGLRQGAFNSDDAVIGQSNKEHMLDQASILRELAQAEREKMEAQQREAEFIQSGFKMLEQSRTN